MKISENKLIKLCKAADSVVCKGISKYSCKFSRKDYTQQQHCVLLCMKIKTKQNYREFVDEIELMYPILELLGLDKVPHYTTLNKQFLKLKGRILEMLLVISSQESGKIEASIDATGFDRRHSSRHYTQRTKMRIQSIKATFIVDVGSLCVLSVHNTTTRKHDSQILLPLMNNTSALLKCLYADKGYDSKFIRNELRKQRIRPVIKHREFKNINKAHNSRLKNYGKRNMSETVNSVIKRKYKDFVSSKNWRSQFNEILMMCIVHNLERNMEKLALIIEVFYGT